MSENKSENFDKLIEALGNSEEPEEEILDDDQEFLTKENEDELTQPEIIPTFEDFKKTNYGAPTKYNEDMPQLLFEFYFKPKMRVVKERGMAYGKPIIKTYEVPERFPTVEGFCVTQCISRRVFYNYLEKHPILMHTYEVCKDWAKDVLAQNVLEGKWNYKVGVLIAQNYTDLRELPEPEDGFDDGDGTEMIPPKQKGYDVSQIDRYCGDTIETTSTEVKDGKEESVQVSQEAKNI